MAPRDDVLMLQFGTDDSGVIVRNKEKGLNVKLQISGHGMINMKNVIFLTCRPMEV